MRVLLFDTDAALVRVLIQQSLKEEDLELVGASNAAEGRGLALDGSFDAVVADEGSSHRTGSQILAELGGAVARVLITGVNDVRIAERAIQKGFDGFMVKPFKPRELWWTVRAAVARRQERQRLERVAAFIESTFSQSARTVVPTFVSPRQLADLGTPEYRVFELACQGLRCKEIAARLSIAESTTRGYLHSLYAKLGLEGWDDIQRRCRAESLSGSPSLRRPP